MRGISAVEKAKVEGRVHVQKWIRRKASVNTSGESVGHRRNFADGELALEKTVQRSCSASRSSGTVYADLLLRSLRHAISMDLMERHRGAN